MGGILTRLAARKSRKNGTKVIYIAHGFHFYKGASKKNWMVYYPIEKIFAKLCDMVITINKEDYELEYEVTNFSTGQKIFIELLKTLNIPVRQTDNKIKRFYKAKFK